MLFFWLGIISLTLLALFFIIKPLLFSKISMAENKFSIKNNYLLLLLFILALPIFAFACYSYLGNSKIIAQMLSSQNHEAKIKQEIAKYGSRQNIILALRKKLDQLPKDESSAKGWYLLGKLYFNEKNFSEAIESFKTAMNLKPNDAEYMLDFISAKFYLNHKLSGQDKLVMNQLIKLSPNNVNAINLLALDAYQQNNFEQAVRYWESLLKYFPQDSDDSKMLLEMIRQAQNKIPHSALLAKKTIAVAIDVSAQFKNKISANDILFVYVLESNGPKIPLAAVRLKAQAFPITAILDESASMIPGRSLQNAKNVYVEARVSKSGNALPSANDLVGSSGVFFLTQQKIRVKIHIDKVYSQTH